MCAMRLMSGFYSDFANFDQHLSSSAFSIQTNNWSWYFLRPKQLFLFIQDATHLVTKLRNRLLSQKAFLQIGDAQIAMEFLQDMIDNPQLSRFDHGLTTSDLKPSDRQNYRSCVKITSSDVFDLLVADENTEGICMYLQLIKLIITSYIDKTTSIEERKFQFLLSNKFFKDFMTNFYFEEIH